MIAYPMTPLDLVSQHYSRTLRTVDEIVADLAIVTDEQRSLGWSPCPPELVVISFSDCRAGGNCGLDFSFSTPRAKWLQARNRVKKEMAL